jgi:hypothetical protein
MIWRAKRCQSFTYAAGLDFALSLTCIVLLFTFPSYSAQASTLGKRTLAQLSSDEILALVSSPDPLKNLDPSDPSSHLSKILIPRARTSGHCITYLALNFCLVLTNSRNQKQHHRQGLYRFHSEGTQLAHRRGHLHG